MAYAKRIKPTIQRGETGKHVWILQRSLQDIGVKGVIANGTFDERTFNGIRNYQYTRKIAITGVLDARTHYLLTRGAGNYRPSLIYIKGQAQPYAPGTNVLWTKSRQVMVADRTSGTKGTWFRYEWRGLATGWVKVNAPAGSVFGRNGVAPVGTRRQGDWKTPAGTYAIKFTFGHRNPGAKMTYRTITNRSYWIQSTSQPDYNRWRESYTGRGKGEHMVDYGIQYRQGAVIGYNYDRPIRSGVGSGSGIFLHYATGYTAGCVGINNMTELTNTIKWLDPNKAPVIVIKA